jgi:hypothetical protein
MSAAMHNDVPPVGANGWFFCTLKGCDKMAEGNALGRVPILASPEKAAQGELMSTCGLWH